MVQYDVRAVVVCPGMPHEPRIMAQTHGLLPGILRIDPLSSYPLGRTLV